MIGQNCVIGPNVVIQDSYILNNSFIQNGSKIINSIIGENVTILDNVVILKGCILESNITVGPSVTLPARTRVSFRKAIDEFTTDDETDDEAHSQNLHTTLLGSNAIGYTYQLELSDDEDIDERNVERGYLDYESPSEYSEAEGSTDRDDEEDLGGFDTEDENDWVHEVEQTLQRAFDDNHTTDIAVLELNTLKMAMNITFKDLRHVALPAILSRIPQPHTIDVFNGIIKKWCPILNKFTHSEEDQLDVLDIITHHLVKAAYLVPRMPLILKNFYELDILGEDSILDWHEATSESVGPMKKIREAVIFFFNQ